MKAHSFLCVQPVAFMAKGFWVYFSNTLLSLLRLSYASLLIIQLMWYSTFMNLCYVKPPFNTWHEYHFLWWMVVSNVLLNIVCWRILHLCSHHMLLYVCILYAIHTLIRHMNTHTYDYIPHVRENLCHFFLSEVVWLHLILYIVSPSILLQILWLHFSVLNSILICIILYSIYAKFLSSTFIFWWTTRLMPICCYPE